MTCMTGLLKRGHYARLDYVTIITNMEVLSKCVLAQVRVYPYTVISHKQSRLAAYLRWAARLRAECERSH